jgi:ligand-binding sensor domain-containing protein/signal transduction histidine kinase
LADTVFQHLSTEQGLPSIAVTALAEDADGFIWVGTQNGLARWDGYRFRVYRTDFNDPGSLPDNFVLALHKDTQGRLWVGTLGGGLAKYDGLTDRFIRIPVGKDSISHISIMSMEGDKAGGLWIGTRGGLDHFMPDTGKVVHYRHEDKNPASLPGAEVLSLMLDKNARLWIGTRNGLAHLNPETGTFSRVSVSTASGTTPAITSLKQSSDGKIWIGTLSFGAFMIDPATGADSPQQVREISAISTNISTKDAKDNADDNVENNAGLDGNTIESIYEVTPGQIWLGTGGQGIVVVDSQTLQTRRLKNTPGLRSSLPNDMAMRILRDRSGLIWVGTQRGVSRHDPAQSAVLSLFSRGKKSGGIVEGKITNLRVMPDGRLWLGLGSSGINIINPDTHEIAWLRPDQSQPDTRLPRARIYSIYGPINGPINGLINGPINDSIYIATDRGLYRSDLTGGTIRLMKTAPIDPFRPVRSLLLNDNNLWLGTFNGIWLLDLADSGKPARRPPGLEKLNQEVISILQADQQGRIWIGTSNNGLYRFDPVSGQLQHYRTDIANPNALQPGVVTTVLVDSRGWLWVGTLGGGLSLLKKPEDKIADNKPPLFQRFGIREGLPNVVVNKILEDAQGHIWVSTDAGLAVLDAKSLQIRTLQSAEGVEILAYWSGAGVKTPEGELIFAGDGGLTVVRPALVKTWDYRPPVVVTQIQASGKAVPIKQFNSTKGLAGLSGLSGLAGLSGLLQIEPDANSFAVEFSALDYSNPASNRYAYMLEGYDKDWISTDATRRLAAYTNLPPGDYRLRLRGSNRNGIWTEQELVLPVRVIPAWHQRWWFYLAQVLAVLAVGFAIVQGRTRYFRLREQELTFQVRQRTGELDQKQLELYTANNELNHANEDLNQAVAGLKLSVETLRQLGDIGREITANLDADSVFQSLYQHVNGLLDAPTLTIYRANPETDSLELAFGRDDGVVLAQESFDFDAKDSTIARVARERKELLVELDPLDASAAQIPGTEVALTALFAPLIVADRLLGVMSIQSHRAHAYGERERLIFHTLCAYGAIALANAEALLVLNQAQMQLIQQEKMASLGQLVAGVAHEINTPIGAVKSSGMNIADSLGYALENMPPLLRQLDEPSEVLFLKLINHANKPAPVMSSREERGVIQQVNLQLEQAGIVITPNQAGILVQLNAQSELENYLPLLRHPDGEQILHIAHSVATMVTNTRNINLAVDKVSRIIFALKSFSHVDPVAEWMEVNLSDGLETVLMIYQTQIKQGCELVCDYQAIPPLSCLPDELNQVWTNLIHNALQAMNYQGTLTIGIHRVGDEAVVSIGDTGGGIAPNIRKKIFEPFFTTKPQGEGSGLGLGIVRKIIDKHKGRIEVNSEIGVGTTFLVYLPYSQTLP